MPGLVGGLPNGGDLTISDSDITATAGSLFLNSEAKLTVSQANGQSLSAGTSVGIYGNSDVDVTLIGRTASIVAGTTLDINSTAGMVSLAGGTLEAADAVNIYGNNGASVSGAALISDNDSVTVQSPTAAILLDSGSISAKNSVTVNGVGMSVDGTAISADSVTGTINMNNSAGVMLVQNNASFTAGYISLNSGDGILLDGASFGGNEVDLKAINQPGHTLNVKNTDFTGLMVVRMDGYTINLLNVNFDGASQVYLRSFFGQLASNPNTGAASMPGYVNFINGVTYGGNPAQNHVNPGGGATTGIFISPL